MTLRHDFTRVAAELREQARRAWGEVRTGDSRALAELWRPELGSTPRPIKRLLEPIVAVSAMAALGVLVGRARRHSASCSSSVRSPT